MPSFLRTKAATVLLGLVSVWLIIAAASATLERTAQRHSVQLAGVRIDDIQRRSDLLERELEKMRAPQWLALLARQRLGYVRPGETAVFVYKSEDSGIVSQPQASVVPEIPNWRKWLLWLQGATAPRE